VGKGARGGEHWRAWHDGDGGAQWRRRDGSGRGVMGWHDGDGGAHSRGGIFFSFFFFYFYFLCLFLFLLSPFLLNK
jgi:hypothetical protein